MAGQYEPITKAFVENLLKRGEQIDSLLKWRSNFRVTGASFTNNSDGASLVVTPPKPAAPVVASPAQSIPAPTEKYQVLTVIDDTLEPIWAVMRFQH